MKTWKQFILYGMMVTVFFTSCEKDPYLKDSYLNEVLITPRNDYDVANGMLVLEDYSVFDELITLLREAEDTQVERDTIYQNLGINTNSGINYTDNPACLKFEANADYISLRNVEEDALFYELDRGNQDINSIISDPYGKTLLNQDRTIQIESRIFKIFDSGLIVVVANGDISTYSSMNSSNENEISTGYNVRVLGVTGDKVDQYFNISDGGKVISGKLVNEISIDQRYGMDDEVQLVNNSFIEYQDGSTPTFKWVYPDESWYIGVQPDRTFQAGDTVVLVSGNPSNGQDTTIIYPRSCYLGDDLDITQIGPRTYRYSASINWGPPSHWQYELRWVFGDGNTALGEGVHEHTYGPGVDLCDIEVTLQAIRLSNGTVACEFTEKLNYIPECEDRGSDSDEQVFPNNWRIDCKIWVDGGVGGWLTVGNVGSRTKSMKKGFAGIWSGRKAEQVWVSLEGDYLEETPSLCSPDCSIVEVPFLEETETNSGNVQRNLSNSNKVFYESNELWSTHKMKVDGQIRVYTNNGGLLYLD